MRYPLEKIIQLNFPADDANNFYMRKPLKYVFLQNTLGKILNIDLDHFLIFLDVNDLITRRKKETSARTFYAHLHIRLHATEEDIRCI